MASAKDLVAHKLRIIEPVYDVANSRAEYRLPADLVFFSDLRLINVGTTQAVATDYNGLLGAECVIRALRLYDGATEIDAINDFPQWRAVQKLMVSNDGAISVGKELSKNAIGYIASGNLNLEEGTFGQTPAVETAQGAGTVGQKAWISLKSCFPFLAEVAVLPTAIFRQLRVEVEYHTSAELANFVTDATQTGLTTSRALLLADEITAPAAQQAMVEQFAANAVVWKSPVEDQFLLNATTAPTDADGNRTKAAEQSQRLRAFDSQYVHDLVLKIVPLVTPTSGANTNKIFGGVGSLAQYQGSVQIAVNGANLQPRIGLQGKMRALGQLTDSIGSIATMAIQQFSGFHYNVNGTSAKLVTTAGQLAIWASDVEDMVEDLNVTVRRTGAFGNAQTIDQARVYVYGRVARALILEPGVGSPGGESKYRIANVQN